MRKNKITYKIATLLLLVILVSINLSSVSFAETVGNNPLSEAFNSHYNLIANIVKIFSIITIVSGLVIIGSHLAEGLTDTSKLMTGFYTVAFGMFLLFAINAVGINGQLKFEGLLDASMYFLKYGATLTIAWSLIQFGVAVSAQSAQQIYRSAMLFGGGVVVLISATLLTSLPKLTTNPAIDWDSPLVINFSLILKGVF
ncbi:MAG: hypothetical protein E7B88_01860 [Finegoldia magna]|nr:hypothetical protein [Finegoldia magna]